MLAINSNSNQTCGYSENRLLVIMSKNKNLTFNLNDIQYVECDKFVNNNIYIITSTNIILARCKNQVVPYREIKLINLPKSVKFLYPQGTSNISII